MSSEGSGSQQQQPSDELVSQFLAFTGSADPERATSYLEMCGGDLENAVGLYMEHNAGGPGGGGGGGTMGGGASGAGAAAGSLTSMGGGDEVRAPDAVRTMRLMGDDHMMEDAHAHPYMALMGQMMAAGAAGAAGASVPNAFAVDMDARAAVNAAIQAGDDDDDEDEDDDNDYVMPTQPTTLQDMFAPPVDLMHTAGGFQGARSVAKDARRWLLVNLQRDSEFSCHALNRDVWRDELVENLVREGFIFWQAMDVSGDGQTYAQRYNVRAYPHIAIIDPRTSRLMWRKEGWTQENPLTAEQFAETAADFCSRHSFDRAPVAPSRKNAPNGAVGAGSQSSRPVAHHDMTEEEQLQAAIRASMNSEMNDAGDNDEKEVIDVDENSMEMNDEEEEEEAEPSFMDELISMEVGGEPDSGARVQIRMPDGKRLVRKFAEDARVKTIYAFVAQSNEECKAGKGFDLMSGFPPKDLMSELENTIQSCGLAGGAITARWK